jgi:hypothetical protein
MQVNELELSSVTEVIQANEQADMRQLSELQLAMIGGGCGVATFG